MLVLRELSEFAYECLQIESRFLHVVKQVAHLLASYRSPGFQTRLCPGCYLFEGSPTERCRKKDNAACHSSEGMVCLPSVHHSLHQDDAPETRGDEENGLVSLPCIVAPCRRLPSDAVEQEQRKLPHC